MQNAVPKANLQASTIVLRPAFLSLPSLKTVSFEICVGARGLAVHQADTSTSALFFSCLDRFERTVQLQLRSRGLDLDTLDYQLMVHDKLFDTWTKHSHQDALEAVQGGWENKIIYHATRSNSEYAWNGLDLHLVKVGYFDEERFSRIVAGEEAGGKQLLYHKSPAGRLDGSDYWQWLWVSAMASTFSNRPPGPATSPESELFRSSDVNPSWMGPCFKSCEAKTARRLPCKQ